MESRNDYLAYVKSDAGDTDPHVGTTVLDHFGSMLAYEYGQPGEAAFKTWGATYLRPLLMGLAVGMPRRRMSRRPIYA